MAMKMKQKVALLIKAFVRDYRSVRYPRIRWEEPLVAFARAQDPLFRQLKELVSPTHALPTDFLPDAQTVITFFFLFRKRLIWKILRERPVQRHGRSPIWKQTA